MPANTTILRGNLLPTPSLPADLPSIELTDNSRKVLEKRYLRRGEDGNPIETIDEMFWRVAYHIAKVEEAWDVDVIALAREFYQLMVSRQFFPNSPTFTGAGTPLGQLAACFVLPISDDMGRKSTGIFQTLRDAALIQQTGGGNGFSFSRLRPRAPWSNPRPGKATGPVGFLRVYDHAFGEVAQGGTRRGANMAVLRVDHPDIEEFITCKTNENHITNFNISVGITDAFMHAVENDDDVGPALPRCAPPRLPRIQRHHRRGRSRRYPPARLQTHPRPRPVRQDRRAGPPQRRTRRPLPGRRQPLQPGCPTSTSSKPPTPAVSSGSDRTRTAASVRSTCSQHIGPEGSVDWDKLREQRRSGHPLPG